MPIQWYPSTHLGTKQSPISLTADSKTAPLDDSYLFCNFEGTQGTVNYLNTTIYINTTLNESFGSTYTKLIDETPVSFKATEIRVRMHAEHKIEGQEYADLEVQVPFNLFRFSILNYIQLLAT